MNRFLTAPLLVLVVACSGTDGNGLLGDSGQQNPQDDASTSLPDAGSTDATTPDDSSVASDTSTVDVVTPFDAGIDAHIGPPDSKIQCGSQITCSAQTETCCWHMGSTVKPYECVTNVSACAGTNDVPITCSTTDNCASQGNSGYQCCATGGNFGLTQQCESYDVATVVACKSSCDFSDYEIGCSVQQQNCSDNLQTCVVSKCTDPGATLCQ